MFIVMLSSMIAVAAVVLSDRFCCSLHGTLSKFPLPSLMDGSNVYVSQFFVYDVLNGQ
jgi:hypothetical protein